MKNDCPPANYFKNLETGIYNVSNMINPNKKNSNKKFWSYIKSKKKTIIVVYPH